MARDKGIDYGRGITNIDPESGIRYGVIHQNELLQAWADSSEAYYPCDDCEFWDLAQDDSGEWYIVNNEGEKIAGPYETDEEAIEYANENKSDLGGCDYCEPISFIVNDGEYIAESDSYGDIFITKSPYYTRAQYCSPCAPGACYLTSPTDEGDRAYCFGHEWFYDSETGRAPYPVYRVIDDSIVEPNRGEI